MKSINHVNKTIPNENRKISLKHSSMILAEFFNGTVIELEEKYVYE